LDQKTGYSLKITTLKLRKLTDFQLEFNFHSAQDQYHLFYQSFTSTQLGFLHQSIPWDDLVFSFGLKEYKKGPDCMFSPKGKLALMFLKSYTRFSDEELIENLNGNYDYQFFCGVIIDPLNRITNFKIVSQIRCELSLLLKVEDCQEVLAKHWMPYLKNKDSMTCDATCYESFIRYPTDVKLLWESVEWSYALLKDLSKQSHQSLIRTKYVKWSRRNTSYSKLRRKPKQKRRSMTRGLLRLLTKITDQIDLLIKTGRDLSISILSRQRLSTIQILLGQQSKWFYDEEKPKDRIVSIDKPYIRPIVRGKEIKKVEFGAKVHNFQIDGISFIDRISFDNFNEGKRLIPTIFKAQKLTKTKMKLVGADGIYATNANRTFVSKNNIRTDFKPKGRPAKDEKQRKQLRQMITKERASRMEGSFGTEKQYYGLDKIKARTEKTEILCLFFGIHTANAVRIGKRIAKKKMQQAA